MSGRLLDRIRQVGLVGLVGLLFVTAGCLAPTGTEIENSRAVAEQVESRYETLDGFQATMVQTVESANQTDVTRASVVFEKGAYLKIAYKTGPRAGTVTVIDDPSPSRLIGRADTGSSERGDAEIVGAIAASLVHRNDVVYEGSTTLDQHRVAIFSLTPPADTNTTADHSRLSARRVWIDTDRGVPLKIQSTWSTAGENVTKTIRLQNVSVDSPPRTTQPTPGGATA